MDKEATTTLLIEALVNAVDGNAHQAATALQTLGQQSDGNEMYGVCCALSEAGVIALRRIYGDRAPKPGTADMWAMQQLTPTAGDDPAEQFSLRFLIAYANGDKPTALALYNAAYKASDEEYVDSIGALLATVAGITRLSLDKTRGER